MLGPQLYICPVHTTGEETMDSRCPRCKKLLMAMTDRTGKTEMRCLKCDKIDPMKTKAVKWAESPLAKSASSP